MVTVAVRPIGENGAIGRITTTGNLKICDIHSRAVYGSYGATDIISGPDGKLWFEGTVHGMAGIARISTSGKLGLVTP